MFEFPRLLVATEFPPNASGGGPAVIRKYLRDYPIDHLFWWSLSPDQNQKFGQHVVAHRSVNIPSKMFPQRKFPQIKSWMMENFWSRLATSHLKKTIDELKPDLLWVIPHNWSAFPLAGVLLQSNLPYHISIQDYIEVHDHPRRFGLERCKRMDQLIDQLYVKAMTRDVISTSMREDLAERTDIEANQILRAGLEKRDFEFLSHSFSIDQKEIKIAYAGSILVPEVFEIFLKALSMIRKKLKFPTCLELFGAHSYRNYPWFDPEWMHEHGNLNEEQLNKRLRECTFGFCPMALDDLDPLYNRFSFPTKFSAYLAAGLPIIALGHKSSSIAQIMREFEVGFFSSNSDQKQLALELEKFLSEQNPREKFRSTIIQCAREEFDGTEMGQKLMECFEKCVQKN